MKANFGKSRNERGEKGRGKGQMTLSPMSIAERNSNFASKVKEDFEELLKANNDENIIPIFQYLMSNKYIEDITYDVSAKYKKNKKIMNDIRDAVRLSVKNLIRGFFRGEINGWVEKGLSTGRSRQKVLSIIRNSKAIKPFLEDENIDDEVELIIVDQIKKSLNEQEELIEQEKLQQEEMENKEFVNAVSRYTDGYKFLTGYREIFEGRNGSISCGERKRKFKNLDQYYRFEKIQEKLKEQIFLAGGDEVKAIKNLLGSSKVQLDNSEKEILRNRMERLLRPKTFDVDAPEL